MDERDETLMRRVAGGDAGAFDRIVLRHRDTVVRFLRTRAGESAEDFAQEAFVRLWQSRERYRSGSATVTTYLCTIARRAAVDESRRVHATAPLTGRVAAAESPERQVLGDIEREKLVAAIGALPEALRETARLCLVDDTPYDEAAARLGVPVGTIRSRLNAARKRLRAALPEYRKETTTMSDTLLRDEVAALRREVDAIKGTLRRDPETDPMDVFIRRQQTDLSRELAERGSPAGIGVGIVTFHATASGNGGMGATVGVVTRAAIDELTDVELERRAAYLRLLGDPATLKILRAFARQHFSGERRAFTAEALGGEATGKLDELVAAQVLDRVEEDGRTLYRWGAHGLPAVALFGAF